MEYLEIDNKSPPPLPFFFFSGCSGDSVFVMMYGSFVPSVSSEKRTFFGGGGVKKKKKRNAASGYESVNGRSYASLLKKLKTVLRREVPPHSGFPVVWFCYNLFFLNLSLYSTVKRSVTCKIDYQ